MSDKERAEHDLTQIPVFKRKTNSDFAHYKSLVLELYPNTKVKLEIDEARVLYLTTSMFEFHLLGGIDSAKQWFMSKGNEADYQKALLFEEAAKQPNTTKAVMKYVQGNTLAICNDFKETFTNGSLLRLMCANAYPSAKAELERIINENI